MTLKEFLKVTKITQTDFAKALGMGNVSSLARYSQDNNKLLEMRRTKSKLALDILFEDKLRNESELESYFDYLVTNFEEQQKFKVKIKTLINKFEKEEKIKSLEIDKKINLSRCVTLIEDVALKDDDDYLTGIRVFLELLNNPNRNGEIKYILTYLMKMNNMFDIEEYQDEKQKSIETLLFLALSNDKRNNFIEQYDEILDNLCKDYSYRLRERKTILEEL